LKEFLWKKKETGISSAKKRALQSEARRLENQSFLTKVRSTIRSFEKALSAGDKAAGKETLNAIYSLLDKGVKTGRFKVNRVSRTKSRLSQRLA
jgi:small subunit ribosomal protein S20